MKKRVQGLWLLSALAAMLSVAISLSAQQTAPQSQSPNSNDQTQQAAPPAAQAQPAQPPTSDEPAPPPSSQTATPPASDQNAPAGQTPSTQTPPSQTPQNQAPDQTAPGQMPPPSQSPNQSTAPNSAAAPSAQAGAAQAGGAQAFSGTIVKQGDKYMLQDEASGQTYDIDHQDEVQKYAGKRVRVHGTLDPNGKMIHLQ